MPLNSQCRRLLIVCFGNKKGMGVSTSAHPRLQALALPHFKDKQRSQPTPSDYNYQPYTIHYIIAIADI